MFNFIKYWFILLVAFIIFAMIFEPSIFQVKSVWRNVSNSNRMEYLNLYSLRYQENVSIIKYDHKNIKRCEWAYGGIDCKARATYVTTWGLYVCIDHRDVLKAWNSVIKILDS